MKEIILDLDSNIKIAVNHYDSNKRESVIIICPGCFMCKDARPFLEMSAWFFQYFDVLTMDFRGHGRSSGLFTFTAQEFDDLRTVVNFAKDKYSRIGIMGFSLGAATAIIYTAKYKDVQSIIVVSAPVDFSKIENHFFKKEAVIPAIEKFEFGKSLNIRPGNIFLEKTMPIDVVCNISPIPVLFVTGNNDPIIYPWHTEKLYKKAHEPKSIEILVDGLHAEDLYLKSKNKFLNTCNEWFDKTLTL